MTDLFERIPAPIRSLWNAEVELRKGLWASILNRGQPNPHFSEARRHFDEAVTRRKEPAEELGWGSRAHVAATIEQRRIEDAPEKDSELNKRA